MIVKNKSQISGKDYVMDLDITIEQIEAYYKGALVQDAFPNLSPAEREFIKTGITPGEWDQVFGKGDDQRRPN